MILTRLYELYNRLSAEGQNLPEMGRSLQKFSFRLIIDREGRLLRLEDCRESIEERSYGKKGKESIRTKLVPRLELVPGETKPSGSGLNPCFLWDNAAYLLGYSDPKGGEKKAARAREACRETRRRYLLFENLLHSEAYSAFCRFLEQWEAGSPLPEGTPPDILIANGMIDVLGLGPLHRRQELIDWWKGQGAALWKSGNPDPGSLRRSADSEKTAMCLITGERAPIAELHEPAIKGVAGAQVTGAKLVSFNCRAFESYGKTQSLNAPVSRRAAFAYCNALNYLLGNSASRRRLGDTTLVYWADAPAQQRSELEAIFAQCMDGDIDDADASGTPADPGSPAAELLHPGPADGEGSDAPQPPPAQDEALLSRVRECVRSIAAGIVPRTVIDSSGETPFYILGLAPNAARLSVRFYRESDFGELLGNLAAHGAAISLKPRGRAFKDPALITPRLILRETARDSNDIPPVYAGQLMRAILWKLPYPDSIAMAIIRRFRADCRINYIRCAYLKAWLTRKQPQLNITTMLDTSNQEPGYLLGRLFAALQKTQDDALGNVNRTLRDAFYASASANPAGIFPRLLKLYPHHLAKIDNPGRRIARERLVQDIIGGLDSRSGFPKQLNLEQQGLFAIGYYHQMQAFYTAKSDSTPDAPAEDNGASGSSAD